MEKMNKLLEAIKSQRGRISNHDNGIVTDPMLEIKLSVRPPQPLEEKTYSEPKDSKYTQDGKVLKENDRYSYEFNDYPIDERVYSMRDKSTGKQVKDNTGSPAKQSELDSMRFKMLEEIVKKMLGETKNIRKPLK
jgi:hypothetical protein